MPSENQNRISAPPLAASASDVEAIEPVARVAEDMSNSDAVTIGARGNEIVVHRPCTGEEWSCDCCDRRDPAVWKYDRYHGGPRVETYRCPTCLFDALGVDPVQNRLNDVIERWMREGGSSTLCVTLFGEDDMPEGYEAWLLPDAEIPSGVGHRFADTPTQAILDAAGESVTCRNVQPSSPESAEAIATVMDAARAELFKVDPERNRKMESTAFCWDCGEIVREWSPGESTEAVGMAARRHVEKTGHEVQVETTTKRTFAATRANHQQPTTSDARSEAVNKDNPATPEAGDGE